MKTCLLCGTENEDTAVTCSACGEGSFAEPALASAATPSPADATESQDQGQGNRDQRRRR